MKNIRAFLPENFEFLEVKFSIYLNRLVFVMFFNQPYIKFMSLLIWALQNISRGTQGKISQ